MKSFFNFFFLKYFFFSLLIFSVSLSFNKNLHGSGNPTKIAGTHLLKHLSCAEITDASFPVSKNSQKFSFLKNLQLISEQNIENALQEAQKTWNFTAQRTVNGWNVETPHFSVYTTTDPKNASHIARELERTWLKAELIAQLWRAETFSGTPLKNSPKTSPKNFVRNVQSNMQKVSKIPAEPIFVYIFHQRENHHDSTGRFCELAQNNDRWQIDINMSLNTGAALHQREIHRAVFQSVLLTGGESEIFPAWIQSGLESIFVGDPLPAEVDSWHTLPAVKNKISPVLNRIPYHEISGQEKKFRLAAHLWTGYYLTINDGQNAPDFFRLLHNIYLLSSESFKPGISGKNTQKEMEASEEKKRIAQTRAQVLTAEFREKSFSEKHEFSPSSWFMSPLRTTPLITWHEKVELITDQETTDPVMVPLPDSYQAILEEMGMVLKLIMRVEENPPHENTERLENVYKKIIQKQNIPFSTFDINGTLLLSGRDTLRFQQLFYPSERKYLIQDFDGERVLTATMKNGSVLHTAFKKPTAHNARPEIYILGYEEPKTTPHSP
ncbi:MAG: hypothetical protein Q4C96_11125 [Planctomycetia bacterium]|nr:hypothetical protein [Planctomycetia bacterium]